MKWPMTFRKEELEDYSLPQITVILEGKMICYKLLCIHTTYLQKFHYFTPQGDFVIIEHTE